MQTNQDTLIAMTRAFCITQVYSGTVYQLDMTHLRTFSVHLGLLLCRRLVLAQKIVLLLLLNLLHKL